VNKLGNLVFAGLTSGAIYAVFAFCLCTLFRVSNVLNIAVGDFAMVGVFAANYLLLQGWSLGWAIVGSLLMVGGFSYLFDWALLRSAVEMKRAQDAFVFTLFLTYALSFFLEGIVPHLFGGGARFGPTLWAGGPLHLGRIPIQRAGIIVIGLAIVTGAGFTAFLRLSLSGKAMSACGENPLGALVVGIRQRWFRRGMFVAMGMLAALFGIVEVPVVGISTQSGFALGLTGILAAAIAGFERPGRAVVAGLSIGVAEALIGGYWSTQYEETILYALLVLIVLFAPRVVQMRTFGGFSTGDLSSSNQ
jgi:branched-subunit amino acid ABC-type transport system permease component